MTNSTVSDLAQAHWDFETDVVVAGFGAAGACAAIEALDSGARVLAVDRFDGGGASSASGGVYYGGGTRFQREAGFNDSSEEMFKYLSLELADVVAPRTLRRFCEQSNSNLEWLIDKGLPFDSRFNPAKTSYPGKGVFLYFSGNEQNAACAAVATPAPRGHRVVGRGMTGGAFYAYLERAARLRGVELWRHSPVVGLISDEAGRVVGVEVNRLRPGRALRQHRRIYRLAKRLVGAVSPAAAERWSRRIAAIESRDPHLVKIRARRGVVLTTGGYIFNRELVARETHLYREAAPLGTPGCDGSGILLARALGAATSRMDHVCASRSISPPEAFVGGVIVSAEGRRFINEDAYTATLGRSIAEAPAAAAWLILDRPSLRRALRHSLPGSGRLLLIHCLPALMLILFGSRKGRSFAELAQRCGLPPATLQQSLEDYNRSAKAGAADELGKNSKFCRRLIGPPYYALDISLRSRTAPLPTFSLGGLVVDEDSGAVKRSDGTVLRGLFAAGRAAVGLPSHHYLSGLALADCVFSGRRAGQNAALESTRGVPAC